MAGIKIVDLPALGRDLINTDLLEVSLNGSGSRKITGQEIMNASKLAVGSTPIVSGTVGRLLFQNTGDVLGQSANLFWDDTNGRLGIGGTPGAYKLDVLGVIKTSSIYGKGDGTSDRSFSFDLEKPTGVIPSIVFGAYDNNATRYLAIGGEAGSSKYATQFIYFFTGATNTTVAGTRAMAILPSGNIICGSGITDAGYKLDVNGTARVSGNLTLGAEIFGTTNTYFNGPTLNTGTLRLRFGSVFSNGAFTVDGPVQGTNVIASGTNNQLSSTGSGVQGVLISNTATSTNWRIEGHRTTSGALEFKNDLTNPVLNLFSTRNVGIGTFTDAGFKLDVNGTARVGSTLTVGSPAGSGLINICRTDNAVMTTISSPDVCIINNAQGSGVRLNTDNVTYLHVRGFASQFAANVTGTLTANAGFTRALLINNIINANANNNELAAIYINPTFNNNIYTGVKNIAIQSTIGGAHFNTTAVNDSAVLQADSTTKGFLPPRMTNAQRAAIASPAVGLIVYCTDSTEGLYVYKSTGWTFMV